MSVIMSNQFTPLEMGGLAHILLSNRGLNRDRTQHIIQSIRQTRRAVNSTLRRRLVSKRVRFVNKVETQINNLFKLRKVPKPINKQIAT